MNHVTKSVLGSILKTSLLQGSDTSETRLLQDEKGAPPPQLSVRLIFRASNGLVVAPTTVLHIRQRWGLGERSSLAINETWLYFFCPYLKLEVKRKQNKIGKRLIKYNWKCEWKRTFRGPRKVCYKIINQVICITMTDLTRSCTYRVLWERSVFAQLCFFIENFILHL